MELGSQDLDRLCSLSRDLMCVVSRTGIIVGANGAMLKRLGCAVDELAGASIAGCVHPDDLGPMLDAFRRAEDGKRFEMENRWRATGGIWLLIAWTACADGDRVYASGRDVTEERTAEEVLGHTTAQLDVITDNIPALISYIDREGRYVQVNETYTSWFGAHPEQIVGRRVEDVLTEFVGREYWLQVQPSFERALRGESGTLEAHGISRDGERYADIHYRPDLDDSGAVKGVITLAVDVTRRKRDQMDLGFRAALLDNALEPIFAWYLGGAIIYWNPMAGTLYGFSRDEALGRRSHDLLNERLPLPVLEFEDQLSRTGEWRGELAHTTKDGRRIIVESRQRVIRLDGREVVVESNRDITARRAAESELRASESLARSLAETAPVGIFRATADGFVTWANRRVLKIWGLPESDFSGRGWLSRIHPDDLREIECRFASEDSSNSVGRFHCRLVLPSGEIRNIEAVTAPVAAGDESLGIVGAVEDVTDRLRNEAELRESEEKYRCTVVLSRQIVWTADARGSVESFSALGYELTGTLPAQSLGAGWFHLVHPDDRKPTVVAWRRAVETGTPYQVENRIRVRDGSYHWMRSRAFARRDPTGAIVRWYGITEDIDDRKRAELMRADLNRELERRVTARTRELAEINKELETFSYSVSHDLRAPLRAIDGFGRMLAEDEISRLSDSGVRCINRIRANTQRMGELIDDLLELSRVSRQALDVRRVDLSSMAEAIIDELRRGDPERSVEVRIEPGMTARGDFGLLRIVLENLLENAWKYSGKKPHAVIEFAPGKESGWVVRDNGAGFDPEYSHQLFAPFHRLHRDSEFPGTGIGLATVARIIHRHGGKVWADGERGKGAAFYFTLGGEPAQLAA